MISNKPILVTGATGFIGSHLTEMMVEQGYNVIAFDRYNSNNNWGWLEGSNYKNDFQALFTDNYNEYFQERIVEQGFKKAFKGNWGSQERTKRAGVVQDLNRLSFYDRLFYQLHKIL